MNLESGSLRRALSLERQNAEGAGIARVAIVVVAALAAARSVAAAPPALGGVLGYYSEPALYGERLVFVSEGDLWIATLGDPTQGAPILAHRLTASDGAESHPVFSPDGRRLAFAAQYDGNTDVYVMEIDGGEPKRLTFHPDPDEPMSWWPDGSSVLYRSASANPNSHSEAWRVSALGGLPVRLGFGECSMMSPSATGRRFAFTRWSNEMWHWKRYRGGTAPEIWIGELETASFHPLTQERASDLHPMWIGDRVFYLSDRDGLHNVWSDRPEGGDAKRHTSFAPDPADPTAIEGYDARWPSADASSAARRIVFCQAGALALLDVRNDALLRLDVRLVSDRLAARARLVGASDALAGVALSPSGDEVVIETRGELVAVHVETGTATQLTRSAGSRERGASYIDAKRIGLLTDRGGEEQVAVLALGSTEEPKAATRDREDRLFPPVASRDGKRIAFADKTMRLHVIDLESLERMQVDRAEAGEITDYRFSPDGDWLAYVKPLANGMSEIALWSVRTRRIFSITDGRSLDGAPRWDPAGKYLYFLAERNLDPVIDALDLQHAFVRSTQVYAVSLDPTVPPPLRAAARAAGFDLDAWAKAEGADSSADGAAAKGATAAPGAAPEGDMPGDDEVAPPVAPPGAPGAPAAPQPQRVEPEGILARQFLLPIEAGRYRNLEAIPGGFLLLSDPVEGLLDDSWRPGGLGAGSAELVRYDLLDEKRTVVASEIDMYAMSADAKVAAWPAPKSVIVKTLASPDEEPETIDLDAVRLRVDARAEWRQMFDEGWRLQRDFFWAPNLAGVDWDAMKSKYALLLDRVGTREELNDVIGEMQGELGTSHAYIFGGAGHEHERVDAVTVGLLGADFEWDGAGCRIARILPRASWDDSLESPLAAAHAGVQKGDRLLAIDGQPIGPTTNPLDLLQGRAEEWVRLTVARDGAPGTAPAKRDVVVRAIPSEKRLRYLAWVESNRAWVAEASGGRIGYVHVPDMMGEGLSLFARQYYPQYRMPALLIDVRDNNGGFISQIVVSRLASEAIASFQPRHGAVERYPFRAPRAHMAALIDQFAGSDGDIFPAAFRRYGLGPLIGTRTWGGVVGIRGDKTFVDLGFATQPEFAWRDEGGWTIENVGVSPDIEVALTPADRVAGRDPQLERAVAVLMEKLEADPREEPPVPPYPNGAAGPTRGGEPSAP